MQRVTVTGGYVDYREPEEVPERLRRRVTVLATKASGMTERVGPDAVNVQADDLEFLLEFNDAVAMCLVVGWSFPEPISIEGLQNLPGKVYDEIVKHGQANVARLLPNFSVDPDPKAPGESSNV